MERDTEEEDEEKLCGGNMFHTVAWAEGSLSSIVRNAIHIRTIQ